MAHKIAFIGGGNMAASLITGLLRTGVAAEDILVAEPDDVRRNVLETEAGIHTSADNNNALDADVTVLAVKPQIMRSVCKGLRQGDPRPLFVSIAAGIRSIDLDRWLGGDNAIVRCMPNTPALTGTGASGLYANEMTTDEQRKIAGEILDAVGITVWVDEEAHLDAVTAVSGSGPAYFFLMMEAMQSAGVSLGLDETTARDLVIQTALGAARMADESEVTPDVLRSRVTSKGGTTEKAIESFETDDFRGIVIRALAAARDRSAALADELGNDGEEEPDA